MSASQKKKKNILYFYIVIIFIQFNYNSKFGINLIKEVF